jgi:NADH dehydrogenase FAD-containing subunit
MAKMGLSMWLLWAAVSPGWAVPANWPLDLAGAAASVCLVDHGHAVPGPFSEKAHEYASRVLKREGVQIRLGTSVQR